MKRSGRRLLAAALSAALVFPAIAAGGVQPVSGAQEQALSVTYADGTKLEEIPGGSLKSPDEKTEIALLASGEGRIYYRVEQNGRAVIEPSALGIKLEHTDYSGPVSIGQITAPETRTDSYELPAGGVSRVEDSCREMSVELKPSADSGDQGERACRLILRSYNDGVAYRYELTGPEGTQEKVLGESGEYSFSEENTRFWLGNTSNTYEVDYNAVSAQSLKNRSANYTIPALARVADGKEWVLVSEANVFNEEEPYCSSYLTSDKGRANLRVKFGNKVSGVAMTYKNGRFHTPWRVAVVTDSLSGLVNSHLITDVNPSADEETYQYSKWVKSFKADWSWWSEAGDDPIEYGPQKDYIDFAAENGWDGVCLDFGWCLWKDYREKVKELCDYAAKKGVKVMLWYGVNNIGHSGWKDADGKAAYPTYSLKTKEQLEEQFDWAQKAGVSAVKVDYYESDSQETMKQMQQCASIAAEHRLCVLFHGCTLPGGENRTYPNILSYEAVFGEEYHKFGLSSPTVATLLTYPYTRNVAGSMDFTPAALPVPSIPATAGFQLAETAVFESGILNLASSIYAYEGNPALGFLNQIEPSFEQSRLVDEKNALPGQYVAMARKSRTADKWFVGAMTAAARTTDIGLDFLGEGTYHAAIYRDNASGSAVVCETRDVTKNDVIKEELKANGGVAIVFSREELPAVNADYTYYEAEDETAAKCAGGAAIGANSFASGREQANLGYGSGSRVTFTVQASEDGVYDLRMFYKAGKDSQLAYSVNGQGLIKTGLICSGTNSIARTSAYVQLKKGENTIAVCNPNSGFVGLDRIGLSQKPKAGAKATVSDEKDYGLQGADEALKYEYTEYKAIDGQTNAVKEAAGYVGWLGGNPDSYLDITVSAPKAGNYMLRLAYMTGAERKVFIAVNGQKAEEHSCGSTGGYNTDSMGYDFFPVELAAGENTLRLTNPTGDCPNIYSLGVSTVTVEEKEENGQKNTENTENGKQTTSGGTDQKMETKTDKKEIEKQQSKKAEKPKKTKIKKAKSQKNSLRLVLKKVKGAGGYEVQYSLKKSFPKKATVKRNTSSTKLTLKKLKAGKTYYVRVRTFKKVDGKKIYSGWIKKVCKL